MRTEKEFRLEAQVDGYYLQDMMLDLGSDVNILPKKSQEMMGKPVYSPIQLCLANQYRIFPIGWQDNVWRSSRLWMRGIPILLYWGSSGLFTTTLSLKKETIRGRQYHSSTTSRSLSGPKVHQTYQRQFERYHYESDLQSNSRMVIRGSKPYCRWVSQLAEYPFF